MDNIGVVGAFYALAGVTVIASLAVFAVRNLLHAVVFLVLAFTGMAGLFITLSADFLAVAQILIYAGAVSILLVFAVMLTPLADRNNANSLFVLPGVAAGGGFATIVALVAVATKWHVAPGGDQNSFPTTIAAIGQALLGPYVLAFEVASVLLLAALVGSIVLVREEEPA